MAASSWRLNECLSLYTQTWRVFHIGGERYAVKSLVEGDGYDMLVTDFSRCWGECLEGEGVTKRCKALNKHIEAPPSTILKNLQDHLSQQKEVAEYQFKVSDGGELLTLSVDSSLSGLPFKWSFSCKLYQEGKVAEHLSLPLLAMVQELSRQQEEMAKLLRRKDKEIDDYKVRYGPPSRRGLVTPVYDDRVFANEMRMSQMDNAMCRYYFGHKGGWALYSDLIRQVPLQFEERNGSELADFQSGVLASNACLSTNTKLQSLYKDVAKVLYCSKQPRDGVSVKQVGEVGGATVTPSASTGSWVGRVPGSFVPEPPPEGEPPTKQAKTSPSKETELQRREALRKQLEKNEPKTKKKKKLL